MTERTAKTLRERFIPKLVGGICKLFGMRMLLLGVAKVKSHGGDVLELEQLWLIRSSGTQRYPSYPMTQALFAAVMELQMNHLRELRAEQLAHKATPAAPQPTQVN